MTRMNSLRLLLILLAGWVSAAGASPASPGGAWTESVFYRFQGAPDGAQPLAALIADAAGNLYGTTSIGGSGNCNATQAGGCGTVFELLRPSAPNSIWPEVVLYNFLGVPSSNGPGDVAQPNGITFNRPEISTAWPMMAVIAAFRNPGLLRRRRI